ncbi:uncharacterized protein G2W53_038351 [Senna tora]|uniref:Uncharacterized protein n=1 Tax=Senna tora TaxID=362788 RepID=A0A834SNX7_9FABA|nr:uncharacterized protein G2W53_038351 [Senna tora]
MGRKSMKPVLPNDDLQVALNTQLYKRISVKILLP